MTLSKEANDDYGNYELYEVKNKAVLEIVISMLLSVRRCLFIFWRRKNEDFVWYNQ